MTGYDPFAYGQVRLGTGQRQAEGDPDDILFADGGATKAAPPGPASAAADKDWELLDADVDSLLPGKATPQAAVDFATDVLGESAPPPAPVAPPRQRSAAAARPRPTTAAAPVAAPKPKEKLAPAARRPSPMDLRSGHSPAAVFVPLFTLVAGGTGAAWLAMMQQNLVMAGIVGVAAVMAAAFFRVLLKR